MKKDSPKIEIPDIDLDTKDRPYAASLFPEAVRATQISENRLVPHNSGLYFQKIKVDPTTGNATLPYDWAEECGYFKVDLLPNHVYDLVKDQRELDELLDAEVNWDWFLDKRFYNNVNSRYRLTHLSNYHSLMRQYPPKSVEDIAIMIALIRPAKKHLKGKPWDHIKRSIWVKSENEKYAFKKSHAVAFALLVVLHAQLIARKLGLVKREVKEDGFFI